MDSAGTLFFSQLGATSAINGPSITDTNFHHVALTKSGGTVVFYLDGVACPAPTYNVTYTFTGGPGIGYRPDNADNSFYGTIDELRFTAGRCRLPRFRKSMLRAAAGNVLHRCRRRSPASPPTRRFMSANREFQCRGQRNAAFNLSMEL